ncbi:MAG: acyltransferase family protein [Clostridiales bacterium]|nr:acyltransferase family protein [Clostridiales bacterium]
MPEIAVNTSNQVALGREERLAWMDVAKGIGIFLVVYAHANSPYFEYIYLFHMPLFFFLSGFLYNSKGSFWSFLIKKIKSLYIPFVGWNIIVIVIRLIPRFFRGEMTGQLILYYLKRFGKILLTIDWEGDYLGASWFLGALFLVSLVYRLLDCCVREGKYKRSFITLFFITAGLASFYLELPYRLNRTIILGMFYAVGCAIRIHWKELESCFCLVGAGASFILLVWIGTTTRVNMGANEYNNVLLFLLAACLGTYLTVCVSEMVCNLSHPLAQRIERLLAWWGRRSVDILLWQFVMFRLVAAFQFWLEGEPISNAFSTSIYVTDGLWWLAYTVVGVFVPLAWGWLLRQGIWGKALKKLCLIR